MKKILKRVISASLLLLPLVSCDYYIDSNYENESSLVLTTFDTASYTWEVPKDTTAKSTKVAMLDSVVIKAADSLGITLDQTTIDTILSTVKSELEDYGYTVDVFTGAQLDDSIVRDSVKNTYGATVECVVAVDEYTYYSYWYSYWGWYYYPPYVYESKYRTADLFVRMGNLEKVQEGDKKIPMLWELRVNDMVWNNTTSKVNSRVSSFIKDGFNQSSYLNRSK